GSRAVSSLLLGGGDRVGAGVAPRWCGADGVGTARTERFEGVLDADPEPVVGAADAGLVRVGEPILGRRALAARRPFERRVGARVLAFERLLEHAELVAEVRAAERDRELEPTGLRLHRQRDAEDEETAELSFERLQHF